MFYIKSYKQKPHSVGLQTLEEDWRIVEMENIT